MIKSLFAAIASAVFLAALIAPSVYEVFKYLIPDNEYPFSRIFDRVILGTLILTLLIWRKSLSLSSLKGTFSLGTKKQRLSYVAIGSALSFISSALAALFIVGTGELEWGGKSVAIILSKIPIIILGALAVSVIEETFFRVIIFTSFCNRLGQITAAFLSSVIYSVVHFIQPVSSYEYPGFSLLSGFKYLGVVFERLFLPGFEFGFIGLLIVGMTLCAVYARTKSIYLCIGLHTGWVVAIKLCFLTTATVQGYIYPEGISRRYFLVAEPIAWASVLITFAIIVLMHFRASKPDRICTN